MKFNKWKWLSIILLCVFLMAGAKEYGRETNLRIKGWLLTDTTWSGLETWGKTGTVDTLVVAGIDTTFYFFVNAVDSTSKGPLHGYISRNDDTVFVRCDSSLTAAEFKYNWIALSP